MAAACSSAVAVRPALPMYVPSTPSPSHSMSRPAVTFVVVPPGAIPLVRTPWSRYITARDLVRPAIRAWRRCRRYRLHCLAGTPRRR